VYSIYLSIYLFIYLYIYIYIYVCIYIGVRVNPPLRRAWQGLGPRPATIAQPGQFYCSFCSTCSLLIPNTHTPSFPGGLHLPHCRVGHARGPRAGPVALGQPGHRRAARHRPLLQPARRQCDAPTSAPSVRAIHRHRASNTLCDHWNVRPITYVYLHLELVSLS